MSGDPSAGRTSLFGLVSFRPRTAMVLVFLTLTIAVVGYHISQESGSGTKRIEELSREAVRIHSAAKDERNGSLPPADADAIEARVREWTGAKISLPRDDKLFSYRGVAREKFGIRTAAAVRFRFAEEAYLLVVLRPESVGGAEVSPPLSPGSSFLSWEKGGISFVFWERDAVHYLLVSDADLTHTFDLVRRHFT